MPELPQLCLLGAYTRGAELQPLWLCLFLLTVSAEPAAVWVALPARLYGHEIFLIVKGQSFWSRQPSTQCHTVST